MLCPDCQQACDPVTVNGKPLTANPDNLRSRSYQHVVYECVPCGKCFTGPRLAHQPDPEPPKPDAGDEWWQR